MSIKNLIYLKFTQYLVCMTLMIPFLTELSLVTKIGSFVIITNNLVIGLIVILQTLPNAKLASEKYYGLQLVLSTTGF